MKIPNGGTWNVNCVRCGAFTIADAAEIMLRGAIKSLEQIGNISGYIRESSGMRVFNQIHVDLLLSLQTPSLEEKTVRLFLMIAKIFPRPGTNFCLNYWGADMVLEKIRVGKDEPFDEKFIAMFQDILPWLSYGWIEDGQEFAYVVGRTLQDSHGFLEKGLVSSDLRITPAGWSFLNSLKQRMADKPNDAEQDGRSIKGDDMNSEDKTSQPTGGMVINIGSVQGNVGNVSNSQFNFGDFRSVQGMLMERNIPKQARRELEDIMDELKVAPPEKKASWIERGEQWIVKHKEILGTGAELVWRMLGHHA
jgi:hypothetical protein